MSDEKNASRLTYQVNGRNGSGRWTGGAASKVSEECARLSRVNINMSLVILVEKENFTTLAQIILCLAHEGDEAS